MHAYKWLKMRHNHTNILILIEHAHIRTINVHAQQEHTL